QVEPVDVLLVIDAAPAAVAHHARDQALRLVPADCVDGASRAGRKFTDAQARHDGFAEVSVPSRMARHPEAIVIVGPRHLSSRAKRGISALRLRRDSSPLRSWDDTMGTQAAIAAGSPSALIARSVSMYSTTSLILPSRTV